MKHNNLRKNPPTLKIKKGAREVVFTTISCMCDNKGLISFKKNSAGEFQISGHGFSLSNWNMKHDSIDLRWAADENKWDEVIKMINTGTSVIESVRSR